MKSEFYLNHLLSFVEDVVVSTTQQLLQWEKCPDDNMHSKHTEDNAPGLFGIIWDKGPFICSSF